ncbi:MAG: hypothetical protein JRI22_21075, partial [Deltaproteobacteria bacterium]|nr:hypothetical protein [Deltaproteobacteria bacterium]
ISIRPYRSTLDPSAIRKELQTNKGTQFDSEVVDAFLEIERELTAQLRSSRTEKIIPFHGSIHGAN